MVGLENRNEIPPFYKPIERRNFFVQKDLEAAVTRLRLEPVFIALVEMMLKEDFTPRTRGIIEQGLYRDLFILNFNQEQISTALSSVGITRDVETEKMDD